uniref:Tetratricopeptide repeat protein n=1 Tax=Yoonia rhodophyticola TaxID=3137370 RepID=A0AAN0NJY6_9RHOB
MPDMLRFPLKFTFLLFFALAACESAEERAERYFQSGMALLEEGDVDRALIEFRNVFQSNPKHQEARLVYAQVQRDRGFIADAYGQYVHLIEQDPGDVEALIALTELAILSNNWEEADSFGRSAERLAPEDNRVVATTAMLEYRDAVIAERSAAGPAATAAAALAEDPASVIARKVVIDNAIMQGEIPAAIKAVEDGLQIDPAQSELHIIRVGLFNASQDAARTRAAAGRYGGPIPR